MPLLDSLQPLGDKPTAKSSGFANYIDSGRKIGEGVGKEQTTEPPSNAQEAKEKTEIRKSPDEYWKVVKPILKRTLQESLQQFYQENRPSDEEINEIVEKQKQWYKGQHAPGRELNADDIQIIQSQARAWIDALYRSKLGMSLDGFKKFASSDAYLDVVKQYFDRQTEQKPHFDRQAEEKPHSDHQAEKKPLPVSQLNEILQFSMDDDEVQLSFLQKLSDVTGENLRKIPKFFLPTYADFRKTISRLVESSRARKEANRT